MGAMQNQMPTHVAKIESLCAGRSKGLLALARAPAAAA